MYESEWKSSYIKCLYADQRRRSADDLIGGELSGAVEAHFAEAAISGIAIAEVLISEDEISRLFRWDELTVLSDVEFDNFISEPSAWPEEPEEPKPIPPPGFYHIDESYWSTRYDPDDIDWRRSLISVPARFIVFGKEYRGINDGHVFGEENHGIDDDHVATALLHIANPNLVLSRALTVPPLPTPTLIEKYKREQSYLWAKITAATWRFFAIQNPQNKRGLEADLIAQLRQYIHDHDLQDHGTGRGTSDTTMKVVVGRILQQWSNKDVQSRIPVSSSKIRAKAPAKRPIGLDD